jgi:hypothetical protein
LFWNISSRSKKHTMRCSFLDRQGIITSSLNFQKKLLQFIILLKSWCAIESESNDEEIILSILRTYTGI